VDYLPLALGLVLIIEGLLPFLAPAAWRDFFLRVSRMRDGQIRFMGAVATVLGCLLILFF
jgi:uncharacterized protein YjeT (DUF2065 family)